MPTRAPPERPPLVLDGFEPVEGPSYPIAVKVVASAVVVATAVLAVQSAGALADGGLGPGGLAMLAAIGAVVVAGWWAIVRARTSFDGAVIRQTGLWTREVALGDIKRVKLVHVPGLEAVLVPRLVVRGDGLTVATFQTADARVLAAFRRLVHGG